MMPAGGIGHAGRLRWNRWASNSRHDHDRERGSCLLEESFNGASGLTWTPWNTYGYIYPNVTGGTREMYI
jgi:hypothetical protein